MSSSAAASPNDEKARPGRGLRRGLLGLGLAVLLAILLAAIALRPPAGAPVGAAHVRRQDLSVPILSDGNLEPPPGGQCRAPEAATVVSILVKEGEAVSRGTLLVRLENPQLAQTASQARSAALQLSEERTRAASDVDRQRREVEHQKKIVEGDQRLLDASAITRSTYESDELAYRQSLDALHSAQARLQSIDGSGAERTSREALTDESARELEHRLDALQIRAQTAGFVFGLPRQVGETVAAGQVIANVGDPTHLRVRVRVDQPDLPRIAVGQPFVVTFDGLPDKRWEGHVLAVSAGVREAAGREVGEVVGEISDSSRSLPPNASVNVQIVVGQRRAALTIPRAALFRDGERRFVYLLEDGRARQRDVAVGLVGLNDVEVMSGLVEKDVVLLAGASPLSDGLRVTVKDGRG